MEARNCSQGWLLPREPFPKKWSATAAAATPMQISTRAMETSRW